MRIFRGIRKQFWRLGAFLNGFLEGDLNWGSIRLFVIIGLSAVFMLICIFFELYFIRGMDLSALEQLSFLGIKARPFLDVEVAIRLSLRYLLIPLSALAIAMMVGAHYIQDIYELESYTIGLRYLLASMFAIGYPRLRIIDGRMQLDPAEINTLAVIGGPGYVMIRPGNTVLFERLARPSNVRSSGWHFITRFEKIKEIVDLSDQHGYIEKMTPMTKDGMVVSVYDTHYIYRLWGSRREGGITGRTPENPYPYSIQAVRNMAYNRSVGINGLSSWKDTVQLVIDGEIKDYIRENKVDTVTAPPTADSDPRREIRKRLNSPGVRARLKNVGAELLWFDIGHISVEDPNVENQRIMTWGAEWVGDAEVIRSYGEAQRQVFQELGRAEAQAEIIISIASAMAEIDIPDQDRPKFMRNLFLMRASQILEALSRVYEPDQRQVEGGNDD
jgi:hypothetical protein